MTNEEFEKRMEFIIEHQAQFDVNMQKLEARQAVLTEATIANLAMIGKLIDTMDSLAQTQKRTEEELAASQKRVDEKMAETAERLNSLINIVERHINEGHKRKRRS